MLKKLNEGLGVQFFNEPIKYKMTDCSICCDTFTKQPSKKQAKCPYCPIAACVKCTQKYLLGTHEDPHCMGCRRAWPRSVMDTLLLRGWLDGEYKKHRENILVDRERSRLPAAQIIIEQQKEADEREPIRAQLADELATLRVATYAKELELQTETNRIHALRHGRPFGDKKDEERRVFTMPCPATECRGFLSSAYKCGVCDIYVCPHCREMKGTHDAEHTCNADTVATVAKLKKECRNCPDCGTNIFRIEGCAQMFCTNCKTPFDWNSGKKITNGAIHNPHYFEYLRQVNGNVMPRAPGDIPCGANLPTAYRFERGFRPYINREYRFTDDDGVLQQGKFTADFHSLYTAIMTITHIQHVEIPSVTNHQEDTDNSEYNVRFLRGELEEARWKQLLQMKEKRRMKRDEMRQVYEAFVGTCVDIYGQITTHFAEVNYAIPSNVVVQFSSEKNNALAKALLTASKQFATLRGIFNTALMDISRRYKCQVYQLSETYRSSFGRYSKLVENATAEIQAT